MSYWGQQDSSKRLCSKCQKPLTYIEQYKAWYCYSCNSYEAVAQTDNEDIQPQKTNLRCPSCADPLYYIKRYNNNFCYKCNAYSPAETYGATTPAPTVTTEPAPAPTLTEAPKPIITEASAAVPAPKPKCSDCGAEVEQGWIRCPDCGNILESSDIPQRPVTTHDEKPAQMHLNAPTLDEEEAPGPASPAEKRDEPWNARHGGEYSWEPQALREEDDRKESSSKIRHAWERSSKDEQKVRDITVEEARAAREREARSETKAWRSTAHEERVDRAERAETEERSRDEAAVSERRAWDDSNEPVKPEVKAAEADATDKHLVKLDSESEFLVELFENIFTAFLVEPMQPLSFYKSKFRNMADNCGTINKIKVADDGKVKIFFKNLDYNKALAELTEILDDIIEVEAKISTRAKALARAKEAIEPIVKDYQEEIEDLGIATKLLNKAFATKLPTGIPGFDDMLHGGIPNGASILLQGPTSGEKDMFVNQFLGCGLKENGSIMVVVTMISPDEWRSQMRAIGHRLTDFEAEGQICIVDWYTHKNERVRSVEVRGSVVLSSKSITNLEIAIDKAIKTIKDAPTKRAVISVLSPAIKALGFDSVYGFAQSIRGKFKKYGITGLFTLDKGMHSQNEVMSLHSVFDGVFDIERERIGDAMIARIGVLSLKGMTFESRYKQLDMTKEGLEVKAGASLGGSSPELKSGASLGGSAPFKRS